MQLAQVIVNENRSGFAYVHDTAVNVAEFLEAKQSCAVSAIIEYITLENILAEQFLARITGEPVQ